MCESATPRRDGVLARNMLLDVTQFGAVAGADCSDAIIAAIGKAQNGDTVLVPAGGTFLTRPFNITKSGISLQVDGYLSALIDDVGRLDGWPKVPPLPTYGRDRDGAKPMRHQALIMMFGVQNVALRGIGKIDGRGPWWWRTSTRKSIAAGRPHLVEVHSSSHVEICGLTLADSPFWTLHLFHSEHIHVHDLKIRVSGRAKPVPAPSKRGALYEGMAPLWAPNTDGINPDSSRHVLIERCDVESGDDHVAIKSGMNAFARAHSPDFQTANVTVRHNTFRVGMGVSVGSETAGGIRGVRVHHNTFLGDGSFCVALHVKSAPHRGGTIEDVAFTHNRVHGTSALMRLGRFGEAREPPTEHAPTALRTLAWAHNVYEPRLQTSKPVRSKFMCPGRCAGIRLENNSLPPKARWQCVDVQVDGSQQRGMERSTCLGATKSARGKRKTKKKQQRRQRRQRARHGEVSDASLDGRGRQMSSVPTNSSIRVVDADASSWTIRTNVVWLCGCIGALLLLNAPGRSRTANLRRLLNIYLAAHALSTAPAIFVAATGTAATATRDAVLSLISLELILVAAATYFFLGTEMIWPLNTGVWRRRRGHVSARQYTGIVCLPLLMINAFTIASLQLNRKMTELSSAPIALFAYYALAVVWASVGVIVVCRRHWNFWWVRLFAFSAVVGVVDFLLPALAFLGAPIWQPDFLARTIDVLLYLPGAVIALRKLDEYLPQQR